jgi:toxin-antitoxin system PIN domain toxin
VIIPDINLLIYAHDEAAPLHKSSRAWWSSLMENDQPVALPWVVVLGFVRVATARSIVKAPLEPAHAIDIVESWLDQPNVQLLEPGPRHLAILRQLLAAIGVAGNLTTDAHLAAMAIEHQCELHSNDRDFARFPGLRWYNPLG